MNFFKKNTSLIVTIIGAAVLIAGAIFYHGYQYSQSNQNQDSEVAEKEFEQKVEKAIEKYIAKQQEKALKAQEEANKIIQVEGVSVDDDAMLGDPEAAVTIIEFSDFDCFYCQKYAQETYPLLKKNYINNKKVKYVARDFPLASHPLALQKALAAECVREQSNDETYFAFHHLMFTKKATNQEEILELAQEVGVDAKKVGKCLAAEKYRAEVEQDLADGKESGVTGTPAFFINGWFLKGAYPYEKFVEIIEKELALAQSSQTD